MLDLSKRVRRKIIRVSSRANRKQLDWWLVTFFVQKPPGRKENSWIGGWSPFLSKNLQGERKTVGLVVGHLFCPNTSRAKGKQLDWWFTFFVQTPPGRKENSWIGGSPFLSKHLQGERKTVGLVVGHLFCPNTSRAKGKQLDWWLVTFFVQKPPGRKENSWIGGWSPFLSKHLQGERKTVGLVVGHLFCPNTSRAKGKQLDWWFTFFVQTPPGRKDNSWIGGSPFLSKHLQGERKTVGLVVHLFCPKTSRAKGKQLDWWFTFFVQTPPGRKENSWIGGSPFLSKHLQGERKTVGLVVHLLCPNTSRAKGKQLDWWFTFLVQTPPGRKENSWIGGWSPFLSKNLQGERKTVGLVVHLFCPNTSRAKGKQLDWWFTFFVQTPPGRKENSWIGGSPFLSKHLQGERKTIGLVVGRLFCPKTSRVKGKQLDWWFTFFVQTPPGRKENSWIGGSPFLSKHLQGERKTVGLVVHLFCPNTSRAKGKQLDWWFTFFVQTPPGRKENSWIGGSPFLSKHLQGERKTVGLVVHLFCPNTSRAKGKQLDWWFTFLVQTPPG